MHIYGHCPARDEICLVVCSLCGHLLKTQAFEQHWDRWHGPLNRKCSTLPGLAHQQGPCPGLSLFNLSSSKETVTKARYHEASSSHTTLPAHQQSSKKTHKANARYKEINKKMMMLTSVGQSTSRTYSQIHRNTGSKSFLPDVSMIQNVVVVSSSCSLILLFPIENKFDPNRILRILDPEKKRKACSQDPISNVNLVLLSILLIMFADRLLKLLFFFSPLWG